MKTQETRINLSNRTKHQLRIICKDEGRTYDSMISEFIEGYYKSGGGK